LHLRRKNIPCRGGELSVAWEINPYVKESRNCSMTGIHVRRSFGRLSSEGVDDLALRRLGFDRMNRETLKGRLALKP
jgi:hypothetical protein